MLFHVTDALGTVNTLQVLNAGAEITLKLARALAANPHVSYGYSTNPAAKWVKDARGVPVPCFKDLPLLP